MIDYYRGLNVFNVRMIRDRSVNPTSHTIKWHQFSRCGFSLCEEEYLLVDYYPDGNTNNNVFKVYVASSVMDPPDEFNTSGYEGNLHFGFLYYGDANQAIFFVLHENDWGPFQHRFMTNSFTSAVQVRSECKTIWNFL